MHLRLPQILTGLLLSFFLTPSLLMAQDQINAPNFKVEAQEAEVDIKGVWMMDSPTHKAKPMRNLLTGTKFKFTGRAYAEGKWGRKAKIKTHMYEVQTDRSTKGWMDGLNVRIYAPKVEQKDEVFISDGNTTPEGPFPLAPVVLNHSEVRDSIGMPRLARLAHLSGAVKLKVLVSPKGKYVCHMRLEDPHPVLMRAVEAKIRQLRFSSGYNKEGLVEENWVEVTFNFR